MEEEGEAAVEGEEDEEDAPKKGKNKATGKGKGKGKAKAKAKAKASSKGGKIAAKEGVAKKPSKGGSTPPRALACNKAYSLALAKARHQGLGEEKAYEKARAAYKARGAEFTRTGH